MTSGQTRAFVLPTGTVTFLMSDVEGSSRRWEGAPEAMAVAIPRHYELLDEAISRHGGVRPVEQGEGDSVVGAFSRASDALAAALESQRLLTAEVWPEGADLSVRVAVHTGEAQLRDQGNYFGQALVRCARILAVGHGGQVLVSAAAAAVVAERLPAGVTLLDVGVHRLKDLGRPEHVWQLVHVDLRREFPPLRSLDTYRHNLPAQLTPLIGRTHDISDVADLLAVERLVTLTGSAGVGKTRLALAVSAEVLDRYRGGVWWVALAALSDPESIGRAALVVVGARETPGLPMGHQVGAELGAEPSLVVLDNCEHLVAPCAEFVADLLGANSAASVLTTTREPLGVPGEISWRVPSLTCPDPERPLELSALSQYDAVVLFVDRAHRARPSFGVTEANAPAIAQICYRLDGIPLAIELAAARCRQLSAERIAAELDDRFRLLTGGARTVMARQQTLAASVDWSHERLDVQEQVVFRRLGVFSGVFPLEAAEAVVTAPGQLQSEEVFDLVSRLVDKSLVVAGEGVGGEPRYRLLQTLRAYALDRARTADELPGLRDAHAAWWTEWLEPSFAMPSDAILEQVKEFHDNLQAALVWRADDPALGLRLLCPLARAWGQLGRSSDAISAADRLLSRENAEQHTAAWLAAADSSSSLYMEARGPDEWNALLDRVEQVATAAGDDYHLAIARYHRGGEEAAVRARDMARARGDHYLAACATVFLALCVSEDDPAAAEPQIAESEAIADASGSGYLREGMLVVKAMAARCTGDLRRCIELGQQILATRAANRVADIVGPMSFAALLARDQEALRLAAERGERERRRAPGIAVWAETARHRLSLFEGQPSEVDPALRGARHVMVPTFGTLWLACREAIDAGAAAIATAGVRELTRPVPHGSAVVAAVEAAASSDERRWHDALALALDHQLRLIAVDALEGLGVAASHAESWAECVRLLASAERLRDETGYRWRFTFEQQAVTVAEAAAHEALGENAAHAAAAEGRNLDWRQAAAYARRARGERKRPHHGWASLTPTELEAVALVAQGLTNPQIAERLFMSRSTVKTHLEHVFGKLDVRSRAELAALAAHHTVN